jgi:hypothetical protein
LEYLGRRPEQYCSVTTSRVMAQRARDRGLWLSEEEEVVGVGCTAALATDRPKRGDHRLHVTTRDGALERTYSLRLIKDVRSRQAEEAVLDAVLINAVAAACGIAGRLPPGLLPGEVIEEEVSPCDDPLERFLRGQTPYCTIDPDGRRRCQLPTPALVVPGAFNPIHAGHRGMAAAARVLCDLPLTFELSVSNVDKPPLSAKQVYERIRQFAWRWPLWLTRAPTFVEKATQLPGAAFVVGADTASRIVAPRYYEQGEIGVRQALERIRTQGCRFLVACRIGLDQSIVKLGQLSVPEGYHDLFEEIPESLFRQDISSTQIRQVQTGPPSYTAADDGAESPAS